MRRFTGYSNREEGSTLMLALMGLVFLTVIGLSLAVVTETEMLIGSNEQIANETFYAAEMGVSTAVTQLLVENNLDRRAFAIAAKNGDDDRFLGDKTLGYSVDFSAVYPVHYSNAAYSTANVGGGSEMLSVFFKTSARARRLAWEGDVPDCDGLVNGLASGDDDDDDDDDASIVPPEFEEVQAEEVIDYAFFVSPITSIEISALEAGHRRVDQFGCEAEMPDSSYGQDLPPEEDGT